MSLRFLVEPRDPRPIWRQIEESIQHRVAAGVLPAGSRLPSVRDLAQRLRVNPATVAKAYRRLAAAGVLEVARGDGTYVAQSPPRLHREQQAGALAEAARRYVSVALSLGAEPADAAEQLRAAWQELSAAGKEDG